MADIKGNNIGAPITPFTTEDIYNTHFAKYGQGGLRTVLTILERDQQLLAYREWGMEINLEDGTKYVLVKGLVDTNIMNNDNWKLVVAGEYDDTELQARTAQNESDIVDLENAVLALENNEGKYVLKQVGRQLTEQVFTLIEKEKLAATTIYNAQTFVDNADHPASALLPVVDSGGKILLYLQDGKIEWWHFSDTIKALLDSKIPQTEKGVANGVATLGADGKVPASQLPATTGLQDVIMYPDNGAIVLETSGDENKVFTITKADLQLHNVDNTPDINKPISNATQAALNTKVDKVAGSRLITQTEVDKLAGLENNTATSYDDTELQERTAQNESDIVDVENAVLAVETEVERRVLKVVGKQLSDQNFTLEEKQKLASLEADNSLFKGAYNASTVYAQGEYVVERNSLYRSLYDGNVGYDVDFADADGLMWWEPVIKLNQTEVGLTYALLYPDNGAITLETSDGNVNTISKADLQLDQVDNTRDSNKPISTSTQNALNNKVDKVAGKQLTDVNFSQADKTKLDGLENTTATSYDDTVLKSRVTSVENTVVNKVDKVSGKQLTDVNFSQADKTKLDSLQNTPAYNDTVLKSRVSTVENTLLDKVDKVAGKQLSTEDFTTAYRTKLDSLQNNNATSYDDTAIKERVSATETRLTTAEATVATKVDKVAGKQLTTEDFTSALKTKLETLTQGETVTGFQRQGNNLVLTTSSGTKTVDLTDMVGGGTTTTVVTSEIQTLSGTLDASYSGVLPANSAQILSLVVADGYALMSSEYTVNLAAGTFTINAATATSLSALVAGDAYEVVVQLTSTTDGETGGTKTLEFVFNAGFANDFTTLIGSNQAAEYTSQQVSNVASVTYVVNGSPVSIPFSILAGDNLKVTITRTDANAGAIVSIAN